MAENENIHKGHRQRMWKKYIEHGIDCFEDHEVLEILLFSAYSRRNTNDIAHELIRRFGSLEGVINAEFNELCEVENVGRAAALSICFMNDFAKRFAREDHSGVILDTSDGLRKFCYNLLHDCEVEVAHALLLDSSMSLIKDCRISRGVATSVDFDLKALAEKAIKSGCSNVVLVHNHPKGTALASSTDVASTRRVASALMNIGINLIDHIIVSKEEACSMRTSGMLPDIWF